MSSAPGTCSDGSGESSNGRTADSDSACLGSNPSSPTNEINELVRLPVPHQGPVPHQYPGDAVPQCLKSRFPCLHPGGAVADYAWMFGCWSSIPAASIPVQHQWRALPVSHFDEERERTAAPGLAVTQERRTDGAAFGLRSRPPSCEINCAKSIARADFATEFGRKCRKN